MNFLRIVIDIGYFFLLLMIVCDVRVIMFMMLILFKVLLYYIRFLFINENNLNLIYLNCYRYIRIFN